jgi:hypothetical protein
MSLDGFLNGQNGVWGVFIPTSIRCDMQRLFKSGAGVHACGGSPDPSFPQDYPEHFSRCPPVCRWPA